MPNSASGAALVASPNSSQRGLGRAVVGRAACDLLDVGALDALFDQALDEAADAVLAGGAPGSPVIMAKLLRARRQKGLRDQPSAGDVVAAHA